MSVENIIDSGEETLLPLSATAIALGFEYANEASMAQPNASSERSIPDQARILGVGATIATLGQDIAFYRRDTHWVNVADEYTDPDIIPLIGKEPESNIEYMTWDLTTVDDIFAEKFDRIYAHGRDFEAHSFEQRQKIGQALIHLLDDGGKIYIGSLDENFIEDASYNESKSLLTYSKPKVVKVQDPHLTNLPKSAFKKDKRTQPLHTYAPTPGNNEPKTRRERIELASYALFIDGLYGIVNLGMIVSNKIRRRA